MKRAEKRPHGHALCVGCDVEIDLASKPKCIPVHLGKETLYLCYCSDCARKFSGGGTPTVQRAIDDAESKLSAVDVRAAGYGVVSKVALLEHDFDAVKAYQHGTSIPVRLHLAIMQGRADLAKVGGILVVCSEESSA